MEEIRKTASQEIDEKIAELTDWRGTKFAEVRALIHEALPDVEETIKWRKPSNPGGVTIWEKQGIICTGEVYKDKLKLTFAKGASIPDSHKVFNSSLDAGTRRAYDIFEKSEINPEAFKDIFRAGAELNSKGK